MIKLRTRIFGGLLMLLIAAPEAIPQTAQSGSPNSQVALRKTGKSGNNGSSPVTDAKPGVMPGLCFQPGVGWQRILPELPGATAMPGTNGSIGLAASRSTRAVHAQSTYVRSPSARRAAECAGSSLNKRAFGGGPTVQPAGSTKFGTITSLRVNSPYRAHRSVGLDPVGIAPAPTYFASEAESDAHPGQVGVRAFHAYTSSIKLRRLIRNAPDFRTRIQLQQLQSNPAGHQPRTATKTHAAARKPRQGGRASPTSPRGPDTHDRMRDNPRRLFSGVYR
jgi:hypothetical protein